MKRRDTLIWTVALIGLALVAPYFLYPLFLMRALCMALFASLAGPVSRVARAHQTVALGMVIMAAGLYLVARLGGGATYAKIEAARALGLPVVMIARPDKPQGHVVASAEQAVAWLHDVASLRGV